jgi:hypothetical protein
MRKSDAELDKYTKHHVIEKILLTVNRLNIYILVVGPIIISLLVLGSLLFAGNQVYAGKVPEIYQAASGVIFLAILSLSGLVQIYRREGPGPLGRPVFGIWPMITGYIIAAICWVSIIYLMNHIHKLMTK